MSAEMRFDGRIALVTGAASGIGAATATLLAARGARVVLADRDDAGAVAAVIEAHGGEALTIARDLSRPGAQRELVETALERWGRIDSLVCAAGFLRDRSFAKMSMDDFMSVLRIHLASVAECVHAAWPLLIGQGGGNVLLFTSHAGLFGNFGQANYAAAKLGIVGLMQTLAIEGQRYGVRVNAIAPLAATPMAAGTAIADHSSHLRASDVAATAAFLCHPDTKVSGRIIAVAGTRIAAVSIEQGPVVEITPNSGAQPEDVAEHWWRLGIPTEAPSGAALQAHRIMAP